VVNICIAVAVIRLPLFLAVLHLYIVPLPYISLADLYLLRYYIHFFIMFFGSAVYATGYVWTATPS